MNKVTTYQLIDGIKKNLRLVFIPAILFFALILGLGIKNTSGLYEAETVLMATPADGDPVSYNKLILNEKISNIYTEILKSPDLYKKVEEALKKGGSEISYKDIMDNFESEVNPQAGMVAMTYKDKDEARAHDSLKSIAENFRLMAKDMLNVDNLSYLSEVRVEESSKIRPIIFSVIGAVLGGLLGLVLIIIKILLTDKIAGPDDLRSMGLRVLGECKNETDLLKVKAQVESSRENSILGITSLGKKDSYSFSKDLAKALAREAEVLFITSKNDTVTSESPVKTDGLDLLSISSADSSSILDSNRLEVEVENGRNFYTHILIDEKSPKTPDPYLAARLCDMKIILVDSSTKKADLKRLIEDFKALGIRDCGVVYYY